MSTETLSNDWITEDIKLNTLESKQTEPETSMEVILCEKKLEPLRLELHTFVFSNEYVQCIPSLAQEHWKRKDSPWMGCQSILECQAQTQSHLRQFSIDSTLADVRGN